MGGDRGGARALRRDDVGAIAPGMRADLVLLDAPTRTHLAYRPGVPLVRPCGRTASKREVDRAVGA